MRFYYSYIHLCIHLCIHSSIHSGAWLSEESMVMREEVCEILPFILTLANETFESQKLTKVYVIIVLNFKIP